MPMADPMQYKYVSVVITAHNNSKRNKLVSGDYKLTYLR